MTGPPVIPVPDRPSVPWPVGSYFAEELSAGGRVVFTDPRVFGRPANLLAVTAEEESSIRLNYGREVRMKRDESLVMINVMQVERLEVLEGRVRVFATVVPEWMPALFWTRSVTVLGVADAVGEALRDYGAAKEATLESIKAQTDRLSFDPDSDLYIASRAKTGSADYTTTDDWGDAAVIDSAQYDELTIMIKNTGDTNSADIEVYTKAKVGGEIEYQEYSTALGPGDVAKIQLNGRYAQVIVRAKSSTAGAPATLRIEWIGGK